MLDFTPTEKQISLHGLGFIQVVLPNRQRLHVWHPDLPRRDCYEHSDVHNHRFSFVSRVIKGVQVNQRVDVEIVKAGKGTHDLISHRGPRSLKGGRESEPIAECLIHDGALESYQPGEEYVMPALAYHRTPNTGIVITLMTKIHEGTIHANSVCKKGVAFHMDFDRFQLETHQLWDFVMKALAS